MGMIQDGGGANRAKFFPAGLNAVAKPCDYCKSTAALLFCRVESAFMCIACDAKVHNANDNVAFLKHERVWMCEVCEQAPAAVTCKADAAALCVTCDRDIHSANPLASRHERVQVVPFNDTAESVVMKSAAAATTLLVPVGDCNTHILAAPPDHERKFDSSIAENGYIPDSWISMNPIITTKLPQDTPDLKSVELFFQDSDQFLDFDNYQISSQPYSDSVVPVQTPLKPPVPARLTHDHSPENRFELDFTRSHINSYNNSYTTPSLSHSVSSSSMDVGVVPDGGSSEISYPFSRNINSSVDLSGNQGAPVVGMDREARVLRYKEKRKNRKFEKTIRYASRKAYAETRPRIKGRFAKRTDADSDIDRIFGSGAANFIADSRFGIVPSF